MATVHAAAASVNCPAPAVIPPFAVQMLDALAYEAWSDGYELAADGMPGSCPDYATEAERRAWHKGFDDGLDLWHAETAAEVERMFAEARDREWPPAGSLFGHDSSY
jgi:hypothetical protein